jgi:catechol 2,3-dioxygenase-like lactoylglutathione lyase family enzyme
MDHVVVRTHDPDAAIALYGDALGVRLALDRDLGGRRMLFFRTGKVTLEVVQEPDIGDMDRLWGVAYRVRDIDAARARLVQAGFDVSPVRTGAKPGTTVLTVRDAPGAVPTLILRDPSRD